MNLLRHLSTLRHGRGFGVHSPLAYELISSVLRDRPAYYGDTDISRGISGRRQQRIGRIILRLTARFRPGEVFVPPGFKTAVRAADSRVVVYTDGNSDRADMAVEETPDGIRIRIGKPTATGHGWHGPLILTNERDLRIEIYRCGLSPTLINTTL